MTSVRALLDRGTATLSAANLETPLTDARLLLAHLTNTNPGLLYLLEQVDLATAEQFIDAIERRAHYEPLQYITGLAPFRYETVHVGHGVFIPRPETELLVDLALPFLASQPVASRRFVELCAGSGAVTRSIVRELGGVVAWAVEISDQALPWLRQNLAGTGATVVHADIVGALPELEGSIDAIIVNPPYIPETMRGHLPPDVEGHDPELALFAGSDGLGMMPAVAAAASRLLRKGGLLVCEHHDSQQQQVMELLRRMGFHDVVGHQDLTQRPRAVTASR